MREGGQVDASLWLTERPGLWLVRTQQPTWVNTNLKQYFSHNHLLGIFSENIWRLEWKYFPKNTEVVSIMWCDGHYWVFYYCNIVTTICFKLTLEALTVWLCVMEQCSVHILLTSLRDSNVHYPVKWNKQSVVTSLFSSDHDIQGGILSMQKKWTLPFSFGTSVQLGYSLSTASVHAGWGFIEHCYLVILWK